jgi:hypothetical protein
MRTSHYRLCELTCSTFVILLFALISSIPTNISLYAQNVNITLTPEQVNEVEKDPYSIIQGCSYRLGQKLDPGKLCDAFTNYLHDKCERLDYLSDYCGPIAIYFPKRIIQKQCLLNFPLPNDVAGIERCVKYVVFNPTYANIPLRLTLKSIDFDTSDDSIKTVFSVFNPNAEAINLISISYNITKGGNKIASGGIGESESTVIDCPIFCFDVKPVSTRDIAIPLGVSNPGLIQSSLPYLINGTYRFENSSSGIVSNQFNLTSH